MIIHMPYSAARSDFQGSALCIHAWLAPSNAVDWSKGGLMRARARSCEYCWQQRRRLDPPCCDVLCHPKRLLTSPERCPALVSLFGNWIAVYAALVVAKLRTSCCHIRMQ